MEQHRTRPPHDGTRRGTPPLPPQAARSGGARPAPHPAQKRPAARPAGVRQPGAPLAEGVRRLPNPRLTGLGGGLFCGAVMFVLGCLDDLLLGGSLTVYGVLFLPVCVLTAAWVRKGDLVTAPVVVPIAFAVGLLPVADSSGGVLGRLMGLVTALATQAGWLYGGTLIAGLIVTVRRIALMRRQTVRRRSEAPR
ncbi:MULTISPECIES: DUF6542 domain-containing protein [Streptomyces]|uniref:DUF6542 domain-containing protein n=1 Tax=Streptomyces gilvifuscus TaxID=1550617 RepID=A0ABT5G090_9ACTN|nr:MULTISPECIES: DUF6542 domain-containing protein [Streptomyces]MBK3644384.1 hypothetical protein [Streptomyces sp. MBT33]MDC2958254.1 hypothetical protein [Streptomyces gilvifuscus]